MATQTMFTVLAKLLYATSHNDRIVAELVPSLWKVPFADEVAPMVIDPESQESVPVWVDPETEDELQVFYPAMPSSGNELLCDRAVPGSLPVEPREMFEFMAKTWGDCFVVAQGDENSPLCIISPVLAKHLGTADGGQLNLYAAVVYQFGQLLMSPAVPEDTVWSIEWRQWWASHSRAVLDCMLGGEIAREQAKAGLLAKTTRGKGVYAAKIGGQMFNLEDVRGVRHLAKPGEFYVSTSSPLVKLDGKHVIPWRNPMPFLDCLEVKAVGPATEYCKRPSIEVNEFILPDSKVFCHPFQVSKTAGDVDGDGWQFLCLEKLLQWACNEQNQAAIEAVPGLKEGLLEHFLDEE